MGNSFFHSIQKVRMWQQLFCLLLFASAQLHYHKLQSVAIVCCLGFGIFSNVWLPNRSQLGCMQPVPSWKSHLTIRQINQLIHETPNLKHLFCYFYEGVISRTEYNIKWQILMLIRVGVALIIFDCVPPTAKTTLGAANPLNYNS